MSDPCYARGVAGERRWSREEMEEILRRAAERTHAREDGLHHDDLVAAAREVGIDPGAIDEVADELGREREERSAIERYDRRRRMRFLGSLSVYAVVNTFLFLLDMITPGGPWFMWPLLTWGLFVAMQALRAARPADPEAVAEFSRRERRKREAEQRREAKRRAKEESRRREEERRERRREVEKQFEHAVEEGVTALMSALASRIESAARAAAPPDERPLADTEFNRFVAKQKRAERGEPEPPKASAQVRVGPIEERTEERRAEAGRLVDDDEVSRSRGQRRERR